VHLLYFWRGDNYRRDLNHSVGFHLNQASPLQHQIGIGESLCAFTRKRDGRYALAAELGISAKTMNPRGFRYGSYRVWGDVRRSRYVSVNGQPDISALIRSLAVEANAELSRCSPRRGSSVRRLAGQSPQGARRRACPSRRTRRLQVYSVRKRGAPHLSKHSWRPAPERKCW
jgi:5-methylcytosine-specific restriction protein A